MPKVCIVGGCGRVGFPLALTFADAGLPTLIYDINEDSLKEIEKGKMPFLEKDAEAKLKKVLKNSKLTMTSDPSKISKTDYVIVVTGTSIGEFLNPNMKEIYDVFDSLIEFLRNGQTIILRSTVYPGTTRSLKKLFDKKKLSLVKLAFCPERIAEGVAMKELKELPQIISGVDRVSTISAKKLFSKITRDIIELTPEEAELAKLFTNAWRYIQFAVANQFFTIAHQRGLDYYRILNAIKYKYKRAASLPSAGFAAGPCLLKDTMQLAAFNNNNFYLGHTAMLINEGLPNYIITKLKEKIKLNEKKVGILGMAFKADSDDKRYSLSYKLKKILEIEAKKVYCTDIYIKDNGFYDLETVLDECDIIILGTPHKEYKNLKFRRDQRVVDIWNFWGHGGNF